MIAHFAGREKALEPLGWTGPRAEWITLVCLHSGGIFTRAQCSEFLGWHPKTVDRSIRALIAQRVVTEDRVANVSGIDRVCRVRGQRLYQALGTGEGRRPRLASGESLLRRLLSLDYVLGHPGVGWLPTEPEKVRAFEALGIERRLLPGRDYRGLSMNAWHHFPLRLPVALDAERALFVYVDPGHGTTTALRSWGARHRGLWQALRERGRSVEVVAVVRTWRELERARRTLNMWSRASGPSEPDGAVLPEIARIEQAILQGDEGVLGEYGDLQAGLKRIVELKQLYRTGSRKAKIDASGTWRSSRIPGGGF